MHFYRATKSPQRDPDREVARLRRPAKARLAGLAGKPR